RRTIRVLPNPAHHPPPARDGLYRHSGRIRAALHRAGAKSVAGFQPSSARRHLTADRKSRPRMSIRDAYVAIRAWRRRPTLAAIAIATIAIGIGAATSIYSVVDGVLLRPLALPEPGRLIAIWQTYPSWKANGILASMWDRIPLSQPEFRDLSRMQSSFTSVGIWTGGRALLSVGNDAEQVPTLRASASLL